MKKQQIKLQLALMDKDYRDKIIKLRGREGEKWLEDLPNIIKRYQQRWNIKVFSPYPLSYNYVAPGRNFDGQKVVLKISFPNNDEFVTEIKALEFFNGEVSIKVLKKDTTNGVVLLEKAEPGKSLRNIPERQQISIASQVIKKLHRPITKDLAISFPTVSDWGKAFERYKERFLKVSGPVPKGMFDKAEGIFKEYTKDTKRPVLLHGDLHNDNILSSQRGWLVIDPKGIVGEREFELGAFLRNPIYDYPKASDYKKLETERIIQFAEELGFDKEKLINWAFACAVISILWFLEDEDEFKETYIQNAEILNEIKFK